MVIQGVSRCPDLENLRLLQSEVTSFLYSLSLSMILKNQVLLYMLDVSLPVAKFTKSYTAQRSLPSGPHLPRIVVPAPFPVRHRASRQGCSFDVTLWALMLTSESRGCRILFIDPLIL